MIDPGPTISVAIIEDHPTFRLGLRTRLEREPDLTVVGEGANGQQGADLVAATIPDVVVVDLNLPDVRGIDLIGRLVALSPRTAVLVLTMLDDDSVFAALRAGASGYLLKDAEPTRIVAAIRAASVGEAMFSPTVARRVLGALGEHRRQGTAAELADLTPRELDILEMIAGGLSNAEIARRLVLSQKTVRNYVSNVLTKLQVADRAEAAARGRDAGLG